MKIDVVNIKNEKVEQLDIDKSVFGIEPNNSVIAQYLRVFTNNQRQGTSSTKDRSQVSGGGKKPWKQKGTGRARVGSSRNPLWVGGGVSHGPTPKSWNLNLSKNLKKLAIKSALSYKFINKKAVVLSDFELTKPSTKDMVKVTNNLKVGKTLIVTKGTDSNVVKSASNLKALKVTRHDMLNAFDLLNYTNVLFTKDAIIEISNKYNSTLLSKESTNEN